MIKELKRFLGLQKDYVQFDEYKLYIDPNDDSLGLSTNINYEPIETACFKKEIKKGDTVIDIGANIGYFTMMFSKLVGDAGKVYAFEPSPNVFKILQKNIKINNIKNVILINKAVSNKTGTALLHICNTGASDNRIFDSQDNRDTLKISTITLDDFFSSPEHINFIKIDTQGAEGLVFKGMEKLIKSQNSLKIVSEFLPCGLVQTGISLYGLLQFITSCGYKIYNLNEQKGILEETTISNIIKLYNINNKKYTNLFLQK